LRFFTQNGPPRPDSAGYLTGTLRVQMRRFRSVRSRCGYQCFAEPADFRESKCRNCQLAADGHAERDRHVRELDKQHYCERRLQPNQHMWQSLGGEYKLLSGGCFCAQCNGYTDWPTSHKPGDGIANCYRLDRYGPMNQSREQQTVGASEA